MFPLRAASGMRAWWRRSLCLLGLLLALPLQAAEPLVPAAVDAPQVSLLTFAPGEIYWQRFGHNALLVRDRSGERVYNYGMFDFAQKNFFLNFARGQMLYQLAVQPLGQALYGYQQEGRWVYEQVLDLDPIQRYALVQFLEWNALPENAEYRYDYFSDNCSTRVRDAIDRVIGGTLRQSAEAVLTSRSYRFEVGRLMAPEPALMIAMDFGMGPLADSALTLWDEAFLPSVLMQAVRDVRLRDGAGIERSLVLGERWLLRAPDPVLADTPPNLLPTFLTLGFGAALVLLALAVARRRLRSARIGFAALAALYSLSAGLAGLLLLAGWLLTDHRVMWGNHNLLLLNPLWLLLLPTLLRSLRLTWQPSRFAAQLAMALLLSSLLAALALVMPLPQQYNGHWIALLLPLNAVLLVTLLQAWRRPVPAGSARAK